MGLGLPDVRIGTTRYLTFCVSELPRAVGTKPLKTFIFAVKGSFRVSGVPEGLPAASKSRAGKAAFATP